MKKLILVLFFSLSALGDVWLKADDYSGPWAEIKKLGDEQKFEAASKKVLEVLESAKQKNDVKQWTRALVSEVQYRLGLHGYETAVEWLRKQAWPQDPIAQAVLTLYYGAALETYVSAYQWEIRKRETVVSAETLDLKKWSLDQIASEIQKAFASAWAERERLGKLEVGYLHPLISPGNYPAQVRGTLRDAVTYLWITHLSNSAYWRPEHSNRVYQLDLASHIEGKGASSLTDPGVHPLSKIAQISRDLQDWHRGTNNKEGQLEAYLERQRALHQHFSSAEDRALIRTATEKFSRSFEIVPWWAMAMYDIASFHQSDISEDHLIQAHAFAKKGSDRYPKSAGGLRCFALYKTLESPSLQLQSMSLDATNQRSLLVTHKNLSRLYFRAYPLDFTKYLQKQSYNVTPSQKEIQELLKKVPEIKWTVSLPQTPDFKPHKTFVTPPNLKLGYYAIIGSVKEDFLQTDKNQVSASLMNVSNLVIQSRDNSDGDRIVDVVEGATGKPVPDTKVTLWRYEYGKRFKPEASLQTDSAGRARFPSGPSVKNHRFFLVAEKGKDTSFDLSSIYFHSHQKEINRDNTLLYTDRSIYRPGQKVYWKVLAFNGKEGDFKVQKNQKLEVQLFDSNYKVVAKKPVSTNEYGTASGEFEVPSGRALGSWSLSARAGTTHIQVEEYKRPTFELSFETPKEPLLLNQKAKLSFEAKYYFGLPVTSGKAVWTVTRSARYPWWWSWWCWWNPSPSSPEVIATGTSSIDENGKIELEFVPKAKPAKDEAERAISYSYSISLDATDEGGETQSSSSVLHLGWVDLNATVSLSHPYFGGFAEEKLSITRTSLNGKPLPGKGSYRILRLEEPKKPEMPADQFQPLKGKKKYFTPGDEMSARWESSYHWESEVFHWKDGTQVVSKELVHDEKGLATFAPPQEAGTYRLIYESKDAFGEKFTTRKDFIVARKDLSTPLPFVSFTDSGSKTVGEKLFLMVYSAFKNQPVTIEIYRSDKTLLDQKSLLGDGPLVVEFPITEAHRGGISITVNTLRDYQPLKSYHAVSVPWDNKTLDLEFASFRDKLKPGGEETWTIKVKDPKSPKQTLLRSAELLAYMYDRSLEAFVGHSPASPLGLYPTNHANRNLSTNLRPAYSMYVHGQLTEHYHTPSLVAADLNFHSGYGIGGPGLRNFYGGSGMLGRKKSARAAFESEGGVDEKMELAVQGAPLMDSESKDVAPTGKLSQSKARTRGETPDETTQVRSNFSETAFWKPHLQVDKNGSVSIQFKVPDSVTSWKVWVHAVTQDVKSASLSKEAVTVKDLMVRPYLPRFFREGDQNDLRVMVNNTSNSLIEGTLSLEILDPESQKDIGSLFGLKGALSKPFSTKASSSSTVHIPLKIPAKIRNVAVRVIAKSKSFSDGELRPLPILPGRVHLAESKFVSLKNKSSRKIRFEDLPGKNDPSLLHDRLIVTINAQLFYSVLSSLPYLVNYPYDCTEQILNRFLSTGIVTSVFKEFPEVADMARKFSRERNTQYEKWNAEDPNRKMTLEESPWMMESEGGADPGFDILNVLNPRIAEKTRDRAMEQIKKRQLPNGSFPWFAGGEPSPYVTLYLMYGMAKASEFGVPVPKEMVVSGWNYLAGYFRQHPLTWHGYHFLTFLNYTASLYPDPSWMGEALKPEERRAILDYCFLHWKKHPPYMKLMLALTLHRMDRKKEGKLVLDSVMDSAKHEEDLGTYWAQEDRSWLWYNDTIETHAFALRAITEMQPENAHRDGMVHWLFLNKKLNHWKSTKATAEVIYSVVHYLKSTKTLAVKEAVDVEVGGEKRKFNFEPKEYTGKNAQWVIPGDKVTPKMADIQVSKETPGFAFASATWHYSTEKMPASAKGDLLGVTRAYFKRVNNGREYQLRPLKGGEKVSVGDEIEIHLSITAKHAAEYVHLRDPRPSGFEPAYTVSKWQWDLGLSRYEEVRDSGMNFFMENLPAGEYTLKYRVRAAMGGKFKAAPAQMQSMYAPEFVAFSAGDEIEIIH